MHIQQTAIKGVMVVETIPFIDQRGAFLRLFCERELSAILGERRIVQVNYSRTEAVGAIRGLHYQRPPHAEMKLVRCLRGRVWDVALDLRQGSPTFLYWHAEKLTPDNARMLVIPEGCAHGFQALEGGSELLYLHTAFYEPSTEGGFRIDDPRLKITWPLPIVDLSLRDQALPFLTADFAGIMC
ncbi:MAG TPA: dTDP-4-dehydrorhamnose 3,5-epimerase [Gammaproteobacteria bacterium]|nr:dTDP-4-dehydrorhamnose 3,5-epimerase [Gammaproteobacteria bacterium]